MNSGALGNIIYAALVAASKQTDKGASPRIKHRERSKSFIELLAGGMKKQYAKPSIRCLSKHNAANRSEFGLNELLFDILICDTSVTEKKRLRFVTKGLWVVESELARNRRSAVIDFNKLVLASSENKLFIGSKGSQESNANLLKELIEPARHCSGNVYAALISHPREWKDQPLSTDLYQLQDGEWKEIGGACDFKEN